MANSLEGKSILITGAGKGIGRATALRSAEVGMKIGAFSRSEEDLLSLKQAVKPFSNSIITTAGNIAIESDVNSFVQNASTAFQSIDVLINNAGVYNYAPIEEYTEQQWDDMIATNLKGVFLITKAVVPIMKKQGHGHIIMISSTLGKIGMAERTAYCTSKFGIVGFSKALSEELRPHNIKVTIVYPGFVNTHIFSDLPAQEQTSLPSRTAMTQPETVADMLLNTLKQPHNTLIEEIDFSSWG
ncbi:MAG: SDR family oxidoreductase [bacterium]